MKSRNHLAMVQIISNHLNMDKYLIEMQQQALCRGLFDPESARDWLQSSLANLNQPACECCIRFVEKDEMQDLNFRFRQQNKLTNVLAFPEDSVDESGRILLGDVIICPAVLAAEAKIQKKDLLQHYAHLVIHGILHLKGFDHIAEDEAKEMEKLEVMLLGALGIKNPYDEESL